MRNGDAYLELFVIWRCRECSSRARAAKHRTRIRRSAAACSESAPDDFGSNVGAIRASLPSDLIAPVYNWFTERNRPIKEAEGWSNFRHERELAKRNRRRPICRYLEVNEDCGRSLRYGTSALHIILRGKRAASRSIEIFRCGNSGSRPCGAPDPSRVLDRIGLLAILLYDAVHTVML